MSDMEVREIIEPVIHSNVEVKSVEVFSATEPSRGDWVKTRMCACPDNARTDCRFHSQEESGWKHCPHMHADAKVLPHNGRWLWSKLGGATNFDDVQNDPLEETANKLTAELLNSVKNATRQ